MRASIESRDACRSPPLFDVAALRAIEAQAAQALGDELELMRRAGQAAWRELLEHWPQAQRMLVVCGPGNNGGDGYVLARHAHAVGPRGQRGAVARTLTAQRTGAARACADYEAAGGRIDVFDGRWTPPTWSSTRLFGIGLSRAPDARAAALIEAINAHAGAGVGAGRAQRHRRRSRQRTPVRPWSRDAHARIHRTQGGPAYRRSARSRAARWRWRRSAYRRRRIRGSRVRASACTPTTLTAGCGRARATATRARTAACCASAATTAGAGRSCCARRRRCAAARAGRGRDAASHVTALLARLPGSDGARGRRCGRRCAPLLERADVRRDRPRAGPGRVGARLARAASGSGQAAGARCRRAEPARRTTATRCAPMRS